MTEAALPRLIGDHLLTKLIESDPMGSIYRARARDAGDGQPGFVLVRRFDGAPLDPKAAAAMPSLAGLKGPGIGKRTAVFEGEGVWHLVSDYAPGHSLGRVLDKTLGEKFPIAVDQCLSIIERVVGALDAAYQFRVDEQRVQHGFVVPGLIWVSDEGEVKLTGFGLGPALLAAGSMASAYARYLAPEVRGGGTIGKSADVYSACVIFLELLTAEPIPLQLAPGALATLEVAHDSAPIPDDLRALLEKGLAADPAARYPSPAELKKDLAKILYSGAYTPTTFNLAFFMNNLFRSEMEAEGKERPKEESLRFEDFAPKPKPEAKKAPVSEVRMPPPTAPTFGAEPPPKSKTGPLAAVAVLALLGAGGGIIWYLKSRPPAAPEPAPAASTPPAGGGAAPATTAEQQQKMQEEIQKRVAEAMAKLQEEMKAERDDATKKAQQEQLARLKKEQEESARKLEDARKAAEKAPATKPEVKPDAGKPPEVVAPPAPADADVGKKPAEPDPGAKPSEIPTGTIAPPPASLSTSAADVKEGDLVDFTQLDVQPFKKKDVTPVYPKVAKMRKAEGLVVVSVLVDEKGRVREVKVLREAKDSLLTESAIDAAKETLYEPGQKGGKKVKTWKTETFRFKL